MLKLPSLEVLRDELSEIRLLQLTKKRIEEENKERMIGIHASDLLDPLRAYWKTVDPRDVTDREAMFFTIGKILHHFVLSVGSETQVLGSDTGTREELGILFSPDGHIDKYPAELKTSRATKEPRPDRIIDDYHHYLEQLCIYMVLENVLQGQLWILYISLKDERGRTWPEFRCYQVRLQEEQFYELEAQIFQTRDMLQSAIDNRDPEHLPLCRAWLCGEACTYWGNVCKPEGRYEYGVNKRDWSA